MGESLGLEHRVKAMTLVWSLYSIRYEYCHTSVELDFPKVIMRTFGFEHHMTEKIQVTVMVGDKRVTLEGPEDFVRAEVQRLTNIAVADSRTPVAADHVNAGAGVPPTEREFVALKKPTGH